MDKHKEIKFFYLKNQFNKDWQFIVICVKEEFNLILFLHYGFQFYISKLRYNHKLDSNKNDLRAN
jgi:hypothetical protein